MPCPQNLDVFPAQSSLISLATISAIICPGPDNIGLGITLRPIDSAGCCFCGGWAILPGPFRFIAVIFRCSAIICSARLNFGILPVSCIASSHVVDGSFTSCAFLASGCEFISLEDFFRLLSSLFSTFSALLTAAASLNIHFDSIYYLFFFFFCLPYPLSHSARQRCSVRSGSSPISFTRAACSASIRLLYFSPPARLLNSPGSD